MSEHPILFSAAMVKAILEGRKTQTRRVIKPQPIHNIKHREYIAVIDGSKKQCPYGQPGDRLWVRETWQLSEEAGMYYPETGRLPDTLCEYAADYSEVERKDGGPWKPSIFMPRWASRITLEVVKVRVERLQDMSYEDAVAEGIDHIYPQGRLQFRMLWDSINAKRGYGWDVNPWVWVVEFKSA